jgi:hypothetical protein
MMRKMMRKLEMTLWPPRKRTASWIKLELVRIRRDAITPTHYQN